MILHEGFTLRQSAFKNLLDYALSSLLTLSLVVLFFCGVAVCFALCQRGHFAKAVKHA